MLKSLLIAIVIIVIPIVVFIVGGYFGQDLFGRNHARTDCNRWAEVETSIGKTVTPEAKEFCQVENFEPAFGTAGFLVFFITFLLSALILLVTWGINDIRQEKKREREYNKKWGLK